MGELELDVLTDPSVERSRQLYILSSELSLLRNNMQPIANVISALRDHARSEPTVVASEAASAQTLPLDGANGVTAPKRDIKNITVSPLGILYFRDVEDNVVLLTQQLDIMRRTTNDMIDLTYNQVNWPDLLWPQALLC
jgi:Mg2+ and Co2+ transporter CorA